MSQKLSEALKGCAEIPLFFVAGVYRFENTQEDAKKFFLIALLFLLAQTFMAQVNPDFQNLSYGEIFFRFSSSFLLYCSLYLPAIYMAAKQLGRDEFFPRFVSIFNWINITTFCIMTPLWTAVNMEKYTWDEAYPFLICLDLYAYCYFAFTLSTVFRINWMLGAALSILGMACDEFSRFIIYDLVFNDR